MKMIYCFDQLNSSNKVRIVNSKFLKLIPKKSYLSFFNKDNFVNALLPPIISICSIFLVSSTFIYFYNIEEEQKNKVFINSKKIVDSTITIYTKV